MTAQRVLNGLSEDGFVVSRGRLGTFVADHPPHLFRYGIVFTSDPTGGEQGYWPPAWNALNQEALRVHHVDPRRSVVPYYNITGHKDVKDYQRLLRDVRDYRLAGLILVGPVCTMPLFDVPPFTDHSLPIVHVGMPGARLTGVITLPVDPCGFLRKALDELAGQGCKRVAVIDVPGSLVFEAGLARSEIEKRGMSTRPYWLLSIDHRTSATAKNVLHLLMVARGEDRPDAVVIENPFLVEHATEGLAAAGLRIPEELKVIAGGNYPYVGRSCVPVKWLVSDIREMMRQCLVGIDARRRGELVSLLPPITDLFEIEIAVGDPLQQLVQEQRETVFAKKRKQ